MTDELDLHRASLDEVAAAHANVFDIWSKGLPLEEHVASRLASPSHSRADWYVGCVQGQVVVSLGSYPIAVRLHGCELPAIAIGSVYTLSGYRGRGFAPRLIDFAERESQARGAGLSILYCDIEPNYYARLGYQLCPALEGWRDVRKDMPETAKAPPLIEVEGPDSLAELARLYDAYHGRFALSFARNTEYWQAMFKKFPTDRFFAWRDSAGDWRGYVRVGFLETSQGEVWRITDYGLADPTDQTERDLYAAFLKLARERGTKRAGGWLPNSGATRSLFDLTPRRKEITMVKSLATGNLATGSLGTPLKLDERTLAETCHFCEIDHV